MSQGAFLVNPNDVKPITDNDKTPISEIDNAIKVVRENLPNWANNVTLDEKIELLEQVLENCITSMPDIVVAEVSVRGRDPAAPTSIDLILSTLYAAISSEVLWFLRQRKTTRTPALPGAPRLNKYSGDLASATAWAVPVFPKHKQDADAAMLSGPERAELWLDGSQSIDDINAREPASEPCVVGVLGAGNYGTLMILDTLHWLFSHNSVVVLKANPVQNLCARVFERMMLPLIQANVLRIVYGGLEEGTHLVNHYLVDRLHMTGSDATYNLIMWGTPSTPPPDAVPRVTKPFSAELGGVSPVIVLPYEYSPAELQRMAKVIVMTLGLNDGFTCCASRVVITSAGWPQTDRLLQLVEQEYTKLPPAHCWYPGSARTHQRAQEVATRENLGVRLIGTKHDESEAEYIFIRGVPSDSNSEFFAREFWGAVQVHTVIDAASPKDFAEKAALFCNQRLWGNLSAIVFVPPTELKRNPAAKLATDAAVSLLEYGTIGVNTFGGFTSAKITCSWGGYPTNTPRDVQSGVGLLNNFHRLPKVLKCVAYRESSIDPLIPDLPVLFRTHPILQRGLAGVISQSRSPLGLVWRVPAAYLTNYAWTGVLVGLAAALAARKFF